MTLQASLFVIYIEIEMNEPWFFVQTSRVDYNKYEYDSVALPQQRATVNNLRVGNIHYSIGYLRSSITKVCTNGPKE